MARSLRKTIKNNKADNPIIDDGEDIADAFDTAVEPLNQPEASVDIDDVPQAEPTVVIARKQRRGWTDPVVLVLLGFAIAGFSFAGGRMTVKQGPQTFAEAMTMMRAGTLPTGTPGGGQGGFGGGGSFNRTGGPTGSFPGGVPTGAPPGAQTGAPTGQPGAGVGPRPGG